jgi:hypothetical protein
MNNVPPNEKEIPLWFAERKINFPPVTFRLEGIGGTVDKSVLVAEWKGECVRYHFEYKKQFTPSVLIQTIAQYKYPVSRPGYSSKTMLIVLPYLSEEALIQLDENQISGIDLCGNGILLAPHFRIWRTGYPNPFKTSRPISNPFAGDISIFSRCFLLQNSFASLSELQKFAHARTFDAYPGYPKAGLLLGTASKVVDALSKELIVIKKGNEIVLNDRMRLLTLLRRNAKASKDVTVIGKTTLSLQEMQERLYQANITGKLRSVTTGIGSAGHYRVLSGVEENSFYVDSLSYALELLQVHEGRAFANIRLTEKQKNITYFDGRYHNGRLWASPIQTWLELFVAGPREQEAAEAMETLLSSGKVDDV